MDSQGHTLEKMHQQKLVEAETEKRRLAYLLEEERLSISALRSLARSTKEIELMGAELAKLKSERTEIRHSSTSTSVDGKR
jgi:hypothetical protein